MTTNTIAHPRVVSRDEWLAMRKEWLTKEKELTRERDAVNAERRRLPMVEIDKDYVFEGPNGPAIFSICSKAAASSSFTTSCSSRAHRLPAIRGAYDEGCSGCSFIVDNIGHLAHLHARDTSLVLVSRAPLAKIGPFKARARAGPCRGIPRSGATSTTTSTPRRTKPSPRSSTTTRTRQRSSGRTRHTI